MGKILGIDLGTTNSAMAVMQGGEPEIIPNAQGSRTTPSVVAVDESGKVLVGTSAKNQMVTNAKNTFYSVKRFIGRRFDDPSVQDDLKKVAYEIRKSEKGGVEINFNGEWVAPEAISAKVLAKLKSDAESYLGESVTEAVITVPAYFDDSQRQATKNAGKIAGFDVKRIINEPTAAALAYGLDKKKDELVAVYDLGGGTFDISVLEIGDDVFEVKATNGDTHLGGDDFDAKLIDWIAQEFNTANGMTIQDDPIALQRLKESAEKAKIELSSSEKTTINLPYLTADKSGPKHLNKDITRADLEKLVGELVEKTLNPSRTALKDASVDTKDINEVILVGGMTRMPLIQKKVEEFFGKAPHKGVNPDEVVAIGAAIQGGVFTGETKDITLLDVTPLTLGIETKGEVMTPMISKNTTIPTEKSQVFSTAASNQPAVEVHVLQGERTMAKDNKSLGTFILDGIPPAPAGVPQIEVTFKLDANGILNVSAKDKATNKEQSITITASTQMSEDEINKMVEEAAKHAADDKKARERIEIKNDADTLVHQIEKSLEDLKDKLDDKKREEVGKAKDELKEMIAKDDFDAESVKKKTEEVSKVAQELAAQAYQKAAEDAKKTDTESKEEPKSDTASKDESKSEEGEIVDEKKEDDPGKKK